MHLIDHWPLDEYEAFRALAAREDPPGATTLYAAAMESLLNNDRQCIERILELVKSNTPSDYYLRTYGAVLCDLGFQEEGLRFLRRAKVCNPHGENLASLADRLLDAGHELDALREYDALLRDDSTNVYGLVGRADILSDLNRWGEAEQCWVKALSVMPRNGPTHERLAHCAAQRKAFRVAVYHAKRALRCGCESPGAMWHIRSLAHLHAGQYRRARRAAGRAVRFLPDCEDTLDLLEELEGKGDWGLAFFEGARFEDAYPWLRFEASRERPPGLATLYLGAVKTSLTEKWSRLESAIRKTADNLPAETILRISGETKCDIGLHEQGIADLRDAVRVCASSRNKVALAYQLGEADQAEEARELCEQVLSREPEHQGALFCLGRATQDWEEATAFCTAAIEIAPDISSIHYELAGLFQVRGRYEEAISEYEAAIRECEPGDAEDWTEMGGCYLQLGNLEEADRCVAEALWRCPTHEPTLKLREDCRSRREHLVES